MIPDRKINGSSSAEEKETPLAEQLAQALALHEAMVKICSAASEEFGDVLDLGSCVPFWRERLIPWPQIGELEELSERLEDGGSFDVSDFHAELLALTNDLAIWIVERYFRPVSPLEVSRLNPSFQKAGLGFLLYQCFEKERHWLDQEEQACFQRLFEDWINWVWDGKIQLPLPTDIQTVGQLTAWLGREGKTHIPYPIRPIIKQLAELP